MLFPTRDSGIPARTCRQRCRESGPGLAGTDLGACRRALRGITCIINCPRPRPGLHAYGARRPGTSRRGESRQGGYNNNKATRRHASLSRGPPRQPPGLRPWLTESLTVSAHVQWERGSRSGLEARARTGPGSDWPATNHDGNHYSTTNRPETHGYLHGGHFAEAFRRDQGPWMSRWLGPIAPVLA